MSLVRRFRLRRSRRAAELAKLLAQLDRMAEEHRPWQASRSKRIALGRLS